MQSVNMNESNIQKNYTILLPPPNITGSLHIGHFFNWSLQDVLIRFKQNHNYKTHWKIGIDHAGIATQYIVERELNKQGKTRYEIGRSEFEKLIWQWKDKAENVIHNQAKNFDLSMSWSDCVFTMDKNYQELVKKSFIKLYNDGLIYKKLKTTNWDIKFQSALSDLEVVEENIKSKIYIIEYKLNNNESIKVATTRPETIFADTALAVHPDDERYLHFHNKSVYVPLINRFIPIVLDKSIEINKGTGVMKITPAHSETDYKVGQIHNLETIEIIDKNGLLFNTISEIDGLNVAQARAKVIEIFKNNNLFIEEQDWNGVAKIGEKSKSAIETILTEQWFLDVKKMAEIALEKSKAIEFFPEHLRSVFNNWLINIEPWCISRQIWWGHQLPVYYTKDKRIVCAYSLKEAEQIAQEAVTQESDVLDTWFSSALWPIYNNSMQTSDVLITGKDIIFFWVARMVMFSLYFEDTIPFKKIYFNGIVRDDEGKKMSKTVGNVIDPIEINQEFGKDALRFALLLKSGNNKDIKIQKNEIIEARNFITKIQNINLFLIKYVSDAENPNTEIDNWIENAIIETKEKIDLYLNELNFQQASLVLYDLIYNKFAAWYIECVKLYPSKKAHHFWKIILKIAYPIIPFITQECGVDLNYEYSLNKNNANFEDCINIIKLLRNLKLNTSIEDFNINTDQDLIKHCVKLSLNNAQDIEINIYNYKLYIKKNIANEFVEILKQQTNNANKELAKLINSSSLFNSFTPQNIVNENKANQTNVLKKIKEFENNINIFNNCNNK